MGRVIVEWCFPGRVGLGRRPASHRSLFLLTMYRFWELERALAITWPKSLKGKNEKIETQNKITKPKGGKNSKKLLK